MPGFPSTLCSTPSRSLAGYISAAVFTAKGGGRGAGGGLVAGFRPGPSPGKWLAPLPLWPRLEVLHQLLVQDTALGGLPRIRNVALPWPLHLVGGCLLLTTLHSAVNALSPVESDRSPSPIFRSILLLQTRGPAPRQTSCFRGWTLHGCLGQRTQVRSARYGKPEVDLADARLGTGGTGASAGVAGTALHTFPAPACAASGSWRCALGDFSIVPHARVGALGAA